MHSKIKRYILIGICILVLLGISVLIYCRQTGKENQTLLLYTEKTALELPGRDKISFFKVGNGDILFSTVDYAKGVETLSSLEGELLQAGDNPACLFDQDGHYEIITWDSDRFVTRETIVLGGVGIYDDIRDYAARYNRMQEKYLIEIRDYGKDYAYEDQGLGLQDLYNAILAGNGPDIIAIDPENMDYTALMDKQALEDLRPYLENSEVIREEDIIPSIRELLTYQEQIGMLPTNFYISDWMIKRQYVEEQGSITTEMILRLLEGKQEEIGSGFSKSELLGLLYGSCDAGELLERIDSGELERALEILKDYPEDGIHESNWDLYPAGKIAFLEYIFMGVDDYLLGKAIWGEQGVYLTEDNVFPVGIYLRNCWGISSKSSHKDAAWSFIESFFTGEWMEEVTPNWAFSVNAEYFREQLEQALADKMFVDSSPYMETGSIAEVTREDIEWIHDLVYNARELAGGSSQLLKIIEEEAGSYYAGDKTAGEASAIIRNRVNLYKEEQQ